MRIILALVMLPALVSCASYKGVDDEIVKGFDVQLNQVLLVVKVESAESTDLYPYECPKEECIPFYFWYKYKAEVLDVVKGAFDASNLSFAALHHSHYIKEVTDEWYILIEKFDKNSSEDLGVEYRVVKHDARAFHGD